MGKLTQCERLKILIKNPVFILLTQALSSLYFIITALQYWVTAYLMLVLEMKEADANIYFSVTCSTAPFIGVSLGGLIFSNLGGYNNPRAWLLVLVVGILAVCVAVPLAFVSTRWIAYVLLWGILFFGSFILPTMTGMMLNSVQLPLRATANGIAVFMYNIFGYLPAPFLYGYVSDFGIDKLKADLSNECEVLAQRKLASRRALGMVCFWSIYAVFCYSIALIIKLRVLYKQMSDHERKTRKCAFLSPMFANYDQNESSEEEDNHKEAIEQSAAGGVNATDLHVSQVP